VSKAFTKETYDGDAVEMRTPNGTDTLEVLKIFYND